MNKEENNEHYSYLIQLLDDRERTKYTKVGYTNNLNRRFDELEYQYDANIKILGFWCFSEKEIALNMENTMRLHLKRKKGSHYIRQDRFQRVKITTDDYDYFNREAIFLANHYKKKN